MGKTYLIDTNIIVDFYGGHLKGKLREITRNCINNDPRISIVTKIELLVFPDISTEAIELIKSSTIIGLEDDVLQTIKIRKEYKLKLPDAIIAATAFVKKSVLLTGNLSDFKKVRGLNLFDFY